MDPVEPSMVSVFNCLIITSRDETLTLGVPTNSHGTANRIVRFLGTPSSMDQTLAGAGEDCFRGLFYEVSLALVGVASPAYFQY